MKGRLLSCPLWVTNPYPPRPDMVEVSTLESRDGTSQTSKSVGHTYIGDSCPSDSISIQGGVFESLFTVSKFLLWHIKQLSGPWQSGHRSDRTTIEYFVDYYVLQPPRYSDTCTTPLSPTSPPAAPTIRIMSYSRFSSTRVESSSRRRLRLLLLGCEHPLPVP